jgi:hypothetical protein
VDKDKSYRGDMIPQERGLEGISSYFIFYLPLIVLMEKKSYMRFLAGKAKWLLNSKNSINPSLVCLGGSHSRCHSGYSTGCFYSPTHSVSHFSRHRLTISFTLSLVHSTTHSYFLIRVLAWER